MSSDFEKNCLVAACAYGFFATAVALVLIANYGVAKKEHRADMIKHGYAEYDSKTGEYKRIDTLVEE